MHATTVVRTPGSTAKAKGEASAIGLARWDLLGGAVTAYATAGSFTLASASQVSIARAVASASSAMIVK